jgi:hypothetical protein
MADEAATIWGATEHESEVLGESSRQSFGSSSSKDKSAPRLFDDLGEADWGSPVFEESAEVSVIAQRAQSSLEGVSIASQDGAALVSDKPPETIAETAEFDDFEEGEQGAGGDDDFGEFGDFEENAEDNAFGEEDIPAVAPANASEPARWRPLQFNMNTNSESIASDIRQLLSAPLADGREYPFHDGAASQLSQNKIRQVDGPSQLLVSDESRAMWTALNSQPNLKPVDWMRSKTRRQYLIAIGIPINLDELNTASANGKALPPLALKLDGKADGSGGDGKADRDRDGAKIGRAAKDRESSKPPEFDVERAKQVIALTEDQLTLQSLPALRTLVREVETLTKQASKVLTFHLSQRENHTADAEMYNGLIRDLVTGAAKRVSASNTQSSGVARKASVRASASAQRAGSGRNSPAIGVSNASIRSASPRT